MEAESLPNNRVLVIGLDGVAPDLVTSWVQQGRLPTFARVLKEGVFGKLRSTTPPSSPPAWTSAVTGVNPGKHGIFEFVYYDGHGRRPVDSTRRRTKAIWRILSEKGRKVGVVNVPMTFPPEKVNGFMVSGLMAGLDAKFTYPESLKQELLQRNYRIDVTYEKWASIALQLDRNMTSAAEDAWDADERRKDVVLHLMDGFDWDFFMVVFVSADRVQHMFWRYMNCSCGGDVVMATYEKLDAILNELLGRVEHDVNVIMISDHGFGPEHKSVRINNWFRSQGMLRLRRSSTGLLRMLGLTEANLVRVARELIGPGRLGRVVQEREHALRRLRHLGMIPRLGLATFEDFDWSRTKACYVFGDAIRMNLKGREPCGNVQPGVEFEELLGHITSGLLELKDPSTGVNPIRAVHRSGDVYRGKYSADAGDLILEMADGYAADEYVGGELIVPSAHRWGPRFLGPSGTHAVNGMISALGPDIRTGYTLGGARIIDVTPTVLYLMGLPIPDYMDGNVLSEALTPSFIQKSPITYEPGESDQDTRDVYTAEELKIVEDRLRALGYLP
jgi:predicted AlkP superfamily phosphohydrolase/phosphomutase